MLSYGLILRKMHPYQGQAGLGASLGWVKTGLGTKSPLCLTQDSRLPEACPSIAFTENLLFARLRVRGLGHREDKSGSVPVLMELTAGSRREKTSSKNIDAVRCLHSEERRVWVGKGREVIRGLDKKDTGSA